MKVAKIALLSLAALGFGFVPQDTLNLTRKYKADDVYSYTITVKAHADQQDIEATANVDMKVTKLLENGSAQITCGLSKVEVKIGGAPTDAQADPFDAAFDATGMPDRITLQEVNTIYTLNAIAGIVPGKDLKIGDSFEIKWESKDKQSKITGKGKLVELTEVEGAKAVKVECELAISPGDLPSSAKATTTAYFALDDNRPLKANGKLEVEGMFSLEFGLKRVK